MSWPARALVAACVVIACSAGNASAAVISSSGPLTGIYVTDRLGCQVAHVRDVEPEFFGGTNPGACGTFLSAANKSFGPNVPGGNFRTQYTVVSQSPVTGSGTSGDPYQVVTVVNAGTTGLRLTQTDSYTTGDESYRTDVTVTNTTASPISASLYHAGDCYLQSDVGFGFHDSLGGGTFCARHANNSPADRLTGFVPLAAGSNFIEDYFSTVWSGINTAGTQFPNSCACSSELDNGVGLSWPLTVPANSSLTRSLLTQVHVTTGKLEVRKQLSPANDPGRFDLQIDETTERAAAGDGDTTGEQLVNTAFHTVGETASAGASLRDYRTSIVCRDGDGAGSIVAQGDDGGPLSVEVNENQDIVCTIKNVRRERRMASASPIQVSLVPVFRQCGGLGNPANGAHSAPLSRGSCLPPATSGTAHVGVQAVGTAALTVVPGDPDLLEDADLALATNFTDVRVGGPTGADYDPNPGGSDMKLQARWRITDDWSCAGSGCGGPHDQPATTTDLDFSVPVDCDGTSTPSIGSTCQVDTSANAVAPGAVKVNGDAVVQTFRTRLVDSGPNGILDDSDDRLFAQQGIYIP